MAAATRTVRIPPRTRRGRKGYTAHIPRHAEVLARDRVAFSRPRGLPAPADASSTACRARRRHLALGAALGVHDLSGGACRQRRRAVSAFGSRACRADGAIAATGSRPRRRRAACARGESGRIRQTLRSGQSGRGRNREAVFVTDFKSDEAGFVRILVLDRGMSAERTGALAQRLVELETYRTLALIGLSEAQRLAPSVGRIERRLEEVTMRCSAASALPTTTACSTNSPRSRRSWKRAPRRACFASARAGPIMKLYKCGSRPSASGRSIPVPHGDRFSRGACSRRCGPASRPKNGRPRCRRSSRERPISCARAWTWNWSSRTAIC
jgi:uncharacterized protein DUF3422